MSTVLIDTSPLTSAHQGRGVGIYTRNLVAALKNTQNPNINFTFTDKPSSIPADLVHYPYFDLFFATLPTNRTPFIVTVHDVIPLLFPKHFPPGIKGKLNFYRQRHALQSAAAIITDSKSSQADIHHYLGISLNRIHVIYLAAAKQFKPVATSLASKFKSKYHLPDHFMSYVGDINYNKNLPLLISAIGQTNFTLVIVTRSKLDSSITEKQTAMAVSSINSALKGLARPEQVRFLNLPDTTSLNLLYNAASWYVQPSLAEGFGLPLLEAMQAGTPVIAARATSLPEIAATAALYFDPTSQASLIKVLHQAESTKTSQLKSLAHLAINQAHNFTWTKTAAATTHVYQSVLDLS